MNTISKPVDFMKEERTRALDINVWMGVLANADNYPKVKEAVSRGKSKDFLDICAEVGIPEPWAKAIWKMLKELRGGAGGLWIPTLP